MDDPPDLSDDWKRLNVPGKLLPILNPSWPGPKPHSIELEALPDHLDKLRQDNPERPFLPTFKNIPAGGSLPSPPSFEAWGGGSVRIVCASSKDERQQFGAIEDKFLPHIVFALPRESTSEQAAACDALSDCLSNRGIVALLLDVCGGWHEESLKLLLVARDFPDIADNFGHHVYYGYFLPMTGDYLQAAINGNHLRAVDRTQADMYVMMCKQQRHREQLRQQQNAKTTIQADKSWQQQQQQQPQQQQQALEHEVQEQLESEQEVQQQRVAAGKLRKVVLSRMDQIRKIRPGEPPRWWLNWQAYGPLRSGLPAKESRLRMANGLHLRQAAVPFAYVTCNFERQGVKGLCPQKLPPGFAVKECDCDEHACAKLRGRQAIAEFREHGLQHRMEIFPLEGPGWGARALQHIHAGDFLMEYVGEIIATHSSEMEDREKWYGKMGWSYCYDAERDEESQHLEKTIDATHLGNASRLVNHSCSPNVQVVHVCQGQIERSLLLLFQATRDIEPNEEITISYQTDEMFEGKEREGGGLKDMFDADPDDPALIKCCCGARNCRKVVLSHDYQLDEMHGASIDAFEAHKQGGKSMPLASSCNSKYRAIPNCSSRQRRKGTGSEHRRDSRQQVGRTVRGFASVQQEGRDAEGRDTASGIQLSMGSKRQRIKEAQDMSAVEPESSRSGRAATRSRASEGSRPEEEEGSREPLRILESVSLGRDATVSQPSAGGKQQQIMEAHAMGAVRPQSKGPGVTAAGSRFRVGCRQQEVVECMDLSHTSTESSSPQRRERGGEPAPGSVLLHQEEVIEILDDEEDPPRAAMPVTIDLTHDYDD